MTPHSFTLLALSLLVCVAPLSHGLSPLEQIAIPTFEKMREVERYQIRIAEKHYTDGDFKTALAEYEKFLTLYEKSPGAPYAQLMWSHTMMHLKKPQTALREGFQSVIDYWPDSHEATLAAYCIADAHRKMGEVKSAQEAFRFLIREYPDHEIALRSRTDLLHYARLHEDEAEQLSILNDLTYQVKRTEATAPTCITASRELAELHFLAQRFAEGKKALATSYEGTALFDTTYEMSVKTVAHLLKQSDTRGAAIKLADQLLASLREEAVSRPEVEKDLLYRAADINSTLGRSAEIWSLYEEIEKRFGRDDALLAKMADWHKARQKPEEARRIYAEFENTVAGLKNIAAMDLSEGKINEAMEIFRKLIELDGGNADDYLWSIADCYERLSDWKSAIATYRQTDRFPANHFAMASCHRKLGEQQQAIDLYNKCKADDDSAPEATLQTAFTHEETKEIEKAIRVFQLTRKRYPKSGQAAIAHVHLKNEYDIHITLGGFEEE